MKRKLLPVFLSFALLANGSLTAFATDSSIDTVTESDAQTTVSEDQGNPEETTQEEVSEDEAVPSDESDAITDFETAYKAYTFGANVSSPDAISADKNTVAVLDVRSSVNYNFSHLEGSFSTPVFNEDGSIIQTSEDATAKAFFATVVQEGLVLLLFYYNVLDMIPVVFIPLQAEQQVLKFVTHSLEQTTL